MNLSKEDRTLFSLIRCAIWQENEMALSELNLSTSEWQGLIDQAAHQGVLALAYDALPKGKPISGLAKELHIRWGLSVQRMEDRNRRQREALKELVGLFRSEGIEVLLLKGLGLSEDYPQPDHRECGDLDIFLFGDYEKGNKIVEKQGIEVRREGTKHSTFFFKGIPVENHLNFLDIVSFKTNVNIEAHLTRILEEQGFSTILIDDVELRIPTPDFTAIFLTCHDITHFLASGLVLRYLCDLALFFTHNAASINFQPVLQILKEESQLELLTSFLDLAQNHLGMSTNIVPALVPNGKISEWVFQDTMNNPFRRKGLNKLLKMSVFKRKVIGAIHLYQSKWKYDLVGKGMFRQRLIFSLKAAFSLK